MNKSRRLVAELVILLLLVVMLIILNPDIGHHKNAIRATVSENHPILSLFGAGHLMAVLPSYKSFYILSVTVFKGEIVSVGIAGYVWTNREALRL